MRRLAGIACLALSACLARPAYEPVGGFELVDSPQRAEWSDLPVPELERLLARAAERLRSIADYEAVLETRERIEDVLYPRREMRLRLRQEPFAVAIETLAPASEKGERVWYEPARNRGRLVAERPGFLGSLVGRVALDPDGDLAMENRRHPITDIGLQRLLEQVEEGLAPALRGRDAPRLRATELAEPRLRLVEALVPGEPFDPPVCHRLGFDTDDGLLVYYGQAELLPDGPALLEEYRYEDVRPDLGLGDSAFRPGE